MNMNKKQIGDSLRESRESQNLSKYRVSKGTGLRPHQIDALEAGSSNYTIDSLLLYMDFLKIYFCFTQ